MLRADKDHIIDAVITTLNIVGSGVSLISSGNSLFHQNVNIEGDLSVTGNIYGSLPALTASDITSTPIAPLTALDVQFAIDQLAGFAHTQNTDTKLDIGGTYEISASEVAQHIKQYIELYDSVGGLVLAFTDSDILFDTQVHMNTNYFHTGGTSVITFNVGGTYQIIYKATTEIISGSHRINAEFHLETDSGGGFLPIPGTTSNTTNRTTGSGPSSTSSVNIITVGAGDDIKLVGRKIVTHITNTSTVKMVGKKTNILITKMD